MKDTVLIKRGDVRNRDHLQRQWESAVWQDTQGKTK